MTAHAASARTPRLDAVTLRVAGTAAELRERIVLDEGDYGGRGYLLADDLASSPDAGGTVYDVIQYDSRGLERGIVEYQVWHGDDDTIVIYDGAGTGWPAEDEPDDPITQQIVAALAQQA